MATRKSATPTDAREASEIVDRLDAWAGGRRQALSWYAAQPISAFGGRTAESLVTAGEANAVRDYLDGLGTGSFA